MAQTKASQRSSTKAKANGGKAKAKPKKAKARTRPASSAKARTRSKAAPGKPQAVLNAAEETAKDAGGKVAQAASRAKVPLMAGGAALAGAAGGIAIGARRTHHKSGLKGVGSKDLAKAAKKAGEVGAQIGEVALEVRRARESGNGNGHGSVHRSPIEVVLQGLTSRGSRS